MAEVDDMLVGYATERLVEEFHPERIYLFGSRAWGEPRDESDLDIMVVVSESDEPATERERRALRALRGVAVRKDVIVRTREEFERRACIATLMESRILRDGKVLYGV